MKKIIALLLAMMMMVSLFAACGAKEEATAEEPAATTEEAATEEAAAEETEEAEEATESTGKDSVTVGYAALATTIDPQGYDTQQTESILSNLYEPLVRVAADGSIIPGAADTWDISPDGLEYTFHLNPDMVFHDGTKVTAEDAGFSLQRCVDSAFVGVYFSYIDKIEATDDNTLVVTLKYAYGPFLSLAGAYSGITSKAYVEEKGDEAFLRDAVGCGPYKFVSWTQGDSMVFEAWDQYHRGEAPIKNLTYKLVANMSSAVLAMQNNELDVLIGVDAMNRPLVEGDENLTLDSTSSLMSSLAAFNCENEYFSDVKVRQACALAINKENVSIAAYDGYAQIANSHLPEGVIGYSEDDITPAAQDVEKAKELMAEAGYPDGFTCKLLVTTGNKVKAEVVQADLLAIGINAELEIVDSAAFYDIVPKGEFDMYVAGWGYICPDADVYIYDMYRSDRITTGNYVRYNNPEVDALLDEGRYATSTEDRQAAYEQVMDIVREDMPNVPLIWNDANIAFNKDLKGVQAINTEQYFVYNWSW